MAAGSALLDDEIDRALRDGDPDVFPKVGDQLGQAGLHFGAPFALYLVGRIVISDQLVEVLEEEELELGETSDDSDERPRGREAVRKADVAAVGCHGQTVCHIPRIDESRGMPGYTRARLLHPVTDDRARTQDGTRRAHCSLWTWERWPRFSKCEVRRLFLPLLDELIH